MNELTDLQYNHEKGMTVHINHLVQLLHQLESFGEPPVSENMKMAYLINSIGRSDSNHFQHILNMHEVVNWSFAQLTAQLYKKESMLKIDVST